jgi:hypothetical protein
MFERVIGAVMLFASLYLWSWIGVLSTTPS